LSPDGQTGYIANVNGDHITVVDMSTREATGSLR
jgi:hypothetical protein